MSSADSANQHEQANASLGYKKQLDEAAKKVKNPENSSANGGGGLLEQAAEKGTTTTRRLRRRPSRPSHPLLGFVEEPKLT